MLPEWPSCQLRWPSQTDILFQPVLAPEKRNRTSDLHMRDQELILNAQDLFALALVGSVAFLVDAPRVVPCASPVVHSSRDKCDLDANFLEHALCLTKVTLD